MTLKLNKVKKFAFVLSICLLIVWGLLGTGASLAWFSDTSPTVKNIFHFANFDLEVSHRLDDGSYEEVTEKTKIFDEKALYEPGYVQVVFLKIENKGDVPFDLSAAVSVADYTLAFNAYGEPFKLQDYLTFGMVTAETEAELNQLLSDREKAIKMATEPLNDYSSELAPLGEREEMYMALVVHMPKKVANEANYRGTIIPRLELGIIIRASQQDMV